MELFRLFGTIMIDDKDAIKALKSTEKHADDAGKKLSGMAKTTAAVGVALVGMAATAGAAMLGMATKIADTTSAIDDSSQRVGMSAENYQKWTYAAKLSGIEASTLEGLMAKQQKSFADATDATNKSTMTLAEQKQASINLEKAQNTLNEAIKKYGKNSIQAREAENKLQLLKEKSVGTTNAQALAYKALGINIKGMTSGDAFNKAIDALAGMNDITQRNAIANDLFGKSYADLAPLLNEGSDGIKALKDEAVKLGAVMSDEDVKAGAKLGDTIDKLKTAFNGVVNQILIKLMPTFQKIADWILLHQDDIQKFAEDVIKGVGNAIAWVSDNSNWLIPVLKTLLGAFLAFQAVSAINAIIAIFNGLLLANPIGIFLVAAAALIGVLVLIYKNWDSITKATQKAINKTLEFFGLKKPSIYSETNLDEGGNAGAAFGGAKGGHWATGGIFTKPTFLQSSNGPALVGEAGMEAVLPISKLPELIGDTMDYGKLESAFRRALSGSKLTIDDDGFATFVDGRIVKAGAY